MKIAILSPGGVSRDGVTAILPWLLWLIDRLVKHGDDVHIFLLRQEDRTGTWSLRGAQIHNAGCSRWRMMGQLIAEHRREPFDILDALWIAPAGVISAILGKLLRLPVLLHLPGGDLVSMPAIGYGGLLRLKSRIYAKFALAGASRIIAPSSFILDQARAFATHAQRLPFGVARDFWPPVPPRPRVPGAIARLLHIADLNKVKDQGTLLKSMACLREMAIPFQLDIIGADTLNGTIQHRSEMLGLSGMVRFHGSAPNAALRPWIDQADILVVSSRHEAGPMVALEAAMAGVPTVGTRVGHLADWCEDGAALAVAVGDSQRLAETIAYVLAHEDERLSLAARAQQKALAEDAEATTLQLREIYSTLVNERRAKARRDRRK